MIQVLSPQEIAPELAGDLKLLDVEDADAAEITSAPALLKYYKRNLAAYCKELSDLLHRGAPRGRSTCGRIPPIRSSRWSLNYLRRDPVAAVI